MKRTWLVLVAVATLAGAARAQDRGAVLDSIQYTGFRYFWDTANPANGLVPDRSTPNSVCSTAATGFGLSAICIGADHGWITRDQAKQRVLVTLNTFWNGPQANALSGAIGYKGLFYHWLDMYSATRRADWHSELSTIDTALLFAGILHAREYFAGATDPDEVQIRALADSITRRAEWDWARNGSQGIVMQWQPDAEPNSPGFSSGKWVGYNEAMIMYLIALGSPTHPVPASDWSYWCTGYNWDQYNPTIGSYVTFPPLFGHQYSHCWVDFRGIRDPYMQFRGIDYFENSRRATLSQIAFARTNGLLEQIFPTQPLYKLGESDSLWGFTASDDPVVGYMAHGAPFGPPDNGTIAPTAPISSVPFAPEEVWPCIRNLWNHRNQVVNGRLYPYWGPYGFGDAFNPEKYQWFTTAVLGIDQGPMVLMIENYRTGMVWVRAMQNADLQRGLQAAGFVPAGATIDPPMAQRYPFAVAASPNPFRGATSLRFQLPRAGHVRLVAYDVQGRQVATLVDERRAAGDYAVPMSARGLAPGLYHYRLELDGASIVTKAVLLN